MSDERLYPLILDPKETPAIWGGDALVRTYGKHADAQAKIGESWECWDENLVANGVHAGKSIAQLRGELGTGLTGDLDPARVFPILTKIIDARDWLSVQVHPDDAYAQRVEHQPNGKTECWYVFSAEPGAQLVLGWTEDTTREEYERRVADGSLGDLLRRVPVNAGDAFYLPSGTLHAIGAGIVLFETQQASDLTYRIFDWNRAGADGKPRELHVAKAADVLDYRRGTRASVEPLPYRFDGMQRTMLIVDPHFAVERVTANADPASLPTAGRPLIVMALQSPLVLTSNGVTVALDAYTTALIPASAQWCAVNAKSESADFMLVTAPKDDSVPVRLLAAGIEQARIDRFMEQFEA